MANLFNGRNTLVWRNLRRLSSFNNNRTKFGIVTILKNEEAKSTVDENIEYLMIRPLPQENQAIKLREAAGGLFYNKQENSFFSINGSGIFEQKFLKRPISLNKESKSTLNDNLEYLIQKPLPQENQALKLREAAGGLFYNTKMDNSLFVSKNGNLFEIKVYKCPTSLIKDFQNYFKSNMINEASISILTITFKTENDMATWNSDVEEEREILIKKFVDSAQDICLMLDKAGYWADFIDPSSGRPYKSPYTHATFYETDERYRQLGFEVTDYGCCKVICHHKLGTKAYVGSLLTDAPQNSEFITRLLKKFNN